MVSDDLFRKTKDGVLLAVRLTPNAAIDRLDGPAEDSAGQVLLKVRVRAVPEKGKANAALIALLARELSVPKSSVQISSGHTARLKTVLVDAPLAEIRRRLAEIV